MAKTSYDTDLDRNAANFQPLTPLLLLERAASVFPDHIAIIHGSPAVFVVNCDWPAIVANNWAIMRQLANRASVISQS